MHSLVFEFQDQTPNYAYGFEVGKLYGQMESGVPEIRGTYHTCSFASFQEISRLLGYSIETLTSLDNIWVDLVFKKTFSTSDNISP
jgi:hypothetical protein